MEALGPVGRKEVEVEQNLPQKQETLTQFQSRGGIITRGGPGQGARASTRRNQEEDQSQEQGIGPGQTRGNQLEEISGLDQDLLTGGKSPDLWRETPFRRS